MKTIIAGSRSINDAEIVLDAIIESGFDITEVICGCAKGIDTLGEIFAKSSNIPIKKLEIWKNRWHDQESSNG